MQRQEVRDKSGARLFMVGCEAWRFKNQNSLQAI